MADSPPDRRNSLPGSAPLPRLPALPPLTPAPPPTAPVPPRRRPVSRACDRCRRRKAKCDYLNPVQSCTLCRDAQVQCTFDMPLARRGPKAKKRNNSTGSPLLDPVSSSLSSRGPPPPPSHPHPPPAAAAIATASSLSPLPLPLPRPISNNNIDRRQEYTSPPTSSTTPWGSTGRLTIDHTLSPQTARSASISGPLIAAPTRAASALQRWHQLSRVAAQRGISLDQMANRCVDLFFQYLYPLTPLVHEPSLRDGLAFFINQPAPHSHIDSGPSTSTTNTPESWSSFSQQGQPRTGPGLLDHWTDATFTLVTAVCAEAAFLLPKDVFPDGESVADMFLQASRNCLHSYLEADLDMPNANSITIRYFHSNCVHAAGKPKFSWNIFGEATRLAQVMQLYEESALDGLHPLEAELRRRTFFIVSMGDKSAAILNNRPITIHKYSFENGITTRYPTGIYDDGKLGPSPASTSSSMDASPRGFMDGFNANLRLWQAAADILLEIRLLQDQRQYDIGVTSPPKFIVAPNERQSLDTLYVRFITCLDDLPPYLHSYTFASAGSGRSEATKSNQFVIQCANLQVSFHCLRMVITQKFEDIEFFAPGVEQADLRKTEIVRDMLRVMHEAPFWALQINGEPYVEKIRLIGASLLAIIHRNGDSPLGMRARGDFTVLLDILTRLDSKASDALRSDSTWTR